MSTRRLAAILFSDIKGFSSRMGRDEEGTFSLLKIHNRILDEAIVAYGGRVVKTIGDAYMAEFSSSVLAVRCALAVQHALAEHNASHGADDAIVVRIGVHAGDVLVDGDDLFGEAVNVAARLEPLAPPGGVCVSPEVLGQVVGKVQARSTALGRRALKNMSEMELYALFPADEALAVPAAPAVEPRRRSRPWAWVTAAFALAILVVAGVWVTRPGGPRGTLRIGYNGALDEAATTLSGFSRMIEHTVEDKVQVVQPDGSATDGAVRVRLDGLTGASLTLEDGVWIAPHPCLPEGRPAGVDDLAYVFEGSQDHTLGIDRVEVDGDTLSLAWPQPNIYAREFLASIRLRGRPPRDCSDTAAMGTGAFYEASETAGGVVTLRANPRSWRPGTPRVAEVVWSPVPSTREGRAAIGRGELDLYFPPYADVQDETEIREGRRVLREGDASVQVGSLAWRPSQTAMMRLFVTFRPGSPLQDVRVRHALAWAIDREALRDEPSFGAPLGRLLTPAMLGYDATLKPWTLDRDRASALLAEVGAAQAPVELVLGHSSGGASAARRIADQVRAVGFSVGVLELTSPEVGALLEDPKVDVLVSGSGHPSIGADPAFLIGAAEHAAGLAGRPELEELARAVAAEPDRSRRRLLYGELERAVLDTAAQIPLAERDVDDGAGGMTVYYGPRLAHLFDERGVWAYPQDWAVVEVR